MKKLFALVMVLAMALAIAAPALASGWDAIPATSPTLKDITVEITALETTPNTSKLGSLYEQLSVMYPVVKGTDIHFLVEITLPKAGNLSAANTLLIANKGLDYEVAMTDNLDLVGDPTYYLNGVVVAAPAWATDDFTGSFAPANVSATLINVFAIEYFAEGNAAGEAVCSATIGFYNVWAGGNFLWDNDADGTDEFLVVHAGNTFTMYVGNVVGNNYYVFTVDANGKINPAVEMTMAYNGTVYAINRAVNGDLTFRNGAVVTTPADTVLYPVLKAAFDSYFTALGFGYADTKYMTDAHFLTYFGTIAETTVKIVYPSGTVVVTEPTVQPPQTGDATTVVGFVMIALALVAAAAVTVKKVRA